MGHDALAPRASLDGSDFYLMGEIAEAEASLSRAIVRTPSDRRDVFEELEVALDHVRAALARSRKVVGEREAPR